MPISKTDATLASKRRLTSDVFELVFEPTVPLAPKAGEYVLFDLAPGVKRAYSIAFCRPNGTLGFIVKRVEGWAGSPLLCDLELGAKIPAMGPMGHFTLRETDVSKCFIGTGTGFAPLYFQLERYAELGFSSPVKLVFGVRTSADLFYAEEIERLANQLPNFSYEPYASRENSQKAKSGRVTDAITEELVDRYEEFYLCGSPSMVKDARSRLEALGVLKDRVYFEQY